jgi:hypothetical protein
MTRRPDLLSRFSTTVANAVRRTAAEAKDVGLQISRGTQHQRERAQQVASDPKRTCFRKGSSLH